MPYVRSGVYAALLAALFSSEVATLQTASAQTRANWAGDPRYRAADRFMARGQAARALRLMRAIYRTAAPGSAQRVYTGYMVGRALLSLRRPAEALPLLAAYSKAFPRSNLGRYNYALSLFAVGRYKEALPLFVIAANSAALTGKARFYAGLCYLYLGERRQGVQFLRATQAITGPGDPFHIRSVDIVTELLVLSAQGAQGRLGPFATTVTTAGRVPTPPGSAINVFGVPQRKRWTLFGQVSVEYDTNAIQLPDQTATPGTIGHKHDWRFIYAVGGGYDVWREGPHRLNVFGTLVGTTYLALSEFDQFSILGGAAYLYTKDRLQLRLVTTLSESWVANNPFSFAINVEPGLTYRQSRIMWIDLDFTFQTADFAGTPATAGEKREGPVYAIKFRQNLTVRKSLVPGLPAILFLGGSLGRASLGSELRHYFVGVNAGVIQYLPWNLVLQLEYDGTFRSFDNASTRAAPAVIRDDSTHIVSVRVQRRITDWATAFVGYRYFRNSSNVTAFRATSHAITSGIRIDM